MSVYKQGDFVTITYYEKSTDAVKYYVINISYTTKF